MKNWNSVILGDGTEKHFYNCCYEGEDIPDDLKRLYEYIRLGKTDSDLTKRIDHAVAEGRKNETWRTQYMKERLLIYDLTRDLQERIDKETKRANDAEALVKKLEAQLAAKS